MVKLKTSSGFTITELIVVVVIIGIFASLVTSIFRDTPAQARNLQTITTVQHYYKAMLSYMSVRGYYPSIPNGQDAVCLGSGYLDRNGDGVGDCRILPPTGPTSSTSTTFNDALAEYVGQNQPKATETALDLWGSPFVGAIFGASTAIQVDGQVSPYYVYYVLEGNQQDCKGRRLLHGSGSDWPATMSLTSATGEKYTWASGKNTVCIISLPNP